MLLERLRTVLDSVQSWLPRMSNWRLLPYFLLLVLMFILFPLALLIARLIIRRAENRPAPA
jgi:choline-glycine betaine transporter